MLKRLAALALVGLLSSCAGKAADRGSDSGAGFTGGGTNSVAGAASGGVGGGAGTSSSSGAGGGGSAAGNGNGGGAGVGGMSGAGGNGGMPANGGGGGGNGVGGAASLADVQAIFSDRCVTCHDKTKLGLPSFPQLSLTPGDSYAALSNKAATETCGGILVVPGEPEHSYLIHKLTEPTPCMGRQMPAPFEIVPAAPLTAVELALIRSWISAGAKPL